MKIIKTIALYLAVLALHAPAYGFSNQESGAEVHLQLCPNSLGALLSGLHLSLSDAENRDTWYLDTRDLELYQDGLILRVRHENDEPESTLTLKLKGLESDQVSDDWFGYKNFKCETDVYKTHNGTPSCSLNSNLTEKEVRQMGVGKLGVKDAMSNLQWKFLKDYGNTSSPWNRVELFGPVSTQFWKTRWPTLQSKITLEVWTLGSSQIFELSVKVPTDEIPTAHKQLRERALSAGIPICTTQQSKTQATLEHLAHQRAFN